MPPTRPAPAQTSGPCRRSKPAATYPFSFDVLLEDAKRRAATPYAPPRNTEPSALDKLSPEEYRSMHFNPDAGIWRAEKLPFRLELLRAAPNLPTVTVSTVEDGRAKDVVATPAMFQMSGIRPTQFARVALPLSGFRVRSRINSNKVWDEFLVFQGASYFRAVAKNLLYGLSARGLAIDTGEPAGEEFPVFTHFWIERPAPRANRHRHLRVAGEQVHHRRLQDYSAHRAWRRLTEVEFTLFPRAEMRVVGIAPLTSMFLFDETNRGHLDDYRPEVHDSDGLQITTKSGEHLFRPVANPLKLQVSSFTTQVPEGFGLVQRSRQQSDFQDFDAQYERRPSAWVVPTGDWGAGAVELVEIPSGRETNDNIVAFWRPAAPLLPGHTAQFAYTISWCAEPPLPKGLGEVVATRSGASIDRKRRVFVLDIVGAGEKLDGLRLDLSASAGAISNSALVSNGEMHGLRASFEIDPKDADLIEMRLRVMRGDTPVSETWLYRWTSS